MTKVVLKLKIRKDLYEKLWNKVTELAKDRDWRMHGLFSEIIEKAILTYVRNHPPINHKLPRASKINDTVSSTVLIDLDVANALIDLIARKYISKRGAKIYEINQAIETYLECKIERGG